MKRSDFVSCGVAMLFFGQLFAQADSLKVAIDTKELLRPKPQKFRTHCLPTLNESDFPLVVVNQKIVPWEIFSKLKSQDVNQIVVLKDEVALRLFGRKGKNGVIVILSK